MNYSGPLADVAPSIFQFSSNGFLASLDIQEKVMGHIAYLLPSLSTGQAALRLLGSWDWWSGGTEWPTAFCFLYSFP